MATSPSLDLDEVGDDFVLRKVQPDGAATTVILSAQDVLTLAQSAPNFRQRILSKLHSTPDFEPVYATPVVQIALHRDALGENILLRLIARNDQGVIFELSRALAEELGRRLLAHAEEMKSANPKAQ